jgi:small-conductance mechanosensitive channel
MSRALELFLYIILDSVGCFLLVIFVKFFFKKTFIKLANHDFSFISNKINKYFHKKDISKTKVIKSLGLESFSERRTKRIETIGSICISIFTFLIFALFCVAIIVQFGIQSRFLVGIFGFIGVALGLGTQTIAKDIVTGLLMVAEDQIGVGDTVEINDIKGKIVNVSARIITVKEDKKNKVHFFPFSQITKVSNFSRDDLL